MGNMMLNPSAQTNSKSGNVFTAEKGSSNVNNNININNDNKNNVNIKSYTINGNCRQKFTINRNGCFDSFDLPCSQVPISSIVKDNIMIVGDTNNYTFCIFSDTPSTLIICNNGKCTKKTYTTNYGQTSSTSMTMSDADCDAVKRKIADEQEKLRIYWQQWEKNFKENMKNKFPPGFPFTNKRSGSTPVGAYNSDSQSYMPSEHFYEYWESEGNKYESTKSGNEHMSGSSDYSENSYGSEDSSRVGSALWWNKWGNEFSNNMKETMNKALPPGFPFNK